MAGLSVPDAETDDENENGAEGGGDGNGDFFALGGRGGLAFREARPADGYVERIGAVVFGVGALEVGEELDCDVVDGLSGEQVVGDGEYGKAPFRWVVAVVVSEEAIFVNAGGRIEVV